MLFSCCEGVREGKVSEIDRKTERRRAMLAKTRKGVWVSLVVFMICCSWVWQGAAEPPALASDSSNR